MGLVDYSDSDSETENVTHSAPAKPATAGGSSSNKKPFQKVVDRSKPGKIRVNLPGSVAQDDSKTSINSDEPPAKRARTSRGGAFSGFNSFLPPPKNVGKQTSAGKGAVAPPPGVNLKTGAAPGFSRDAEVDATEEVGQHEQPTQRNGMGLPAPKSQSEQPSIPAGMKPAEEVKLVGKPLMFKPLSVTRRPAKKSTAKPTPVPKGAMSATTAVTVQQTQPADVKAEPPPKKKISLFSISDEPTAGPEPEEDSNEWYEPLADVDTADASTGDVFDQYGAYAAQPQAQNATSHSLDGVSSNSLESIASDMNLSAAARRELFGRRGAPSADVAAAKVINFDTEREYAHNEILRASGEQQTHNPVRAIAPGKHTLRQLVSQVQNQRDALEESFAKGKAKQAEAGSRYGWR
ncbi:hypothetical protein GGS20DRAFT_2063 [Poronia punctata]|nr:hypothetical protein GGS20DRAFT_2063 [Poronia punctata]